MSYTGVTFDAGVTCDAGVTFDAGVTCDATVFVVFVFQCFIGRTALQFIFDIFFRCIVVVAWTVIFSVVVAIAVAVAAALAAASQVPLADESV